MAYINQSDIEGAGMYPEILKVLSREPEYITTAITDAEAEVKAYLTARYEVDQEYAKTGTNRNTLLVKIVRDVAIYNVYNISNPVNMPDSRVQNYRDKIAFLKEVQAERASIDGLTRRSDATNGGSSYIKFGGNSPRSNHF